MDFFKFMSLVNDRTLFFTRVDKLQEEFDEFEGTWSDATIQLIEGNVPRSIVDVGWRLKITNTDTVQVLFLPLVQKPVDENVQHILSTMHTIPTNWASFKTPYEQTYLVHKPTGFRFGIANAKVVHQLCDAQSSLETFRNSLHIVNEQLKFTLVNCWHIGLHESDAMWSRYSNRNGSIAIKTDVISLVSSFLNRYPTAVGKVQYIAFDTDVMPAAYFDTTYWFKRIEFDTDRELRVVMDETVYTDITEHTRTPDISSEICEIGLPYKVDPQILIREIVVGPGTDHWKFDLIQSVVEKYELDVPVRRSSLRR